MNSIHFQTCYQKKINLFAEIKGLGHIYLRKVFNTARCRASGTNTAEELNEGQNIHKKPVPIMENMS